MKATVPGPLTWLQESARVLPAGSPSSLAEPFRVTATPATAVRFAPALTTGAWLAGACPEAATLTATSLANCDTLMASVPLLFALMV